MGELGVEGSNGGAERRPDSGLGWNGAAPPDPASFKEECLSAAEVAAHQMLSCILPTLDSEEEREGIIDYVVGLIKSHLNCEVVPYGSVPLKTYLPDGDIDFTAINANESLSRDVFALLQMEEKNVVSEFKVKDTQYIDAEVKLVKCLVRNTVVDISFNQLGGLSALCFLEQVDRLVGRNHLFKRSIILVKAWCYYESRILGAHHGLISTYALETLVLYIFQLYHTSLVGPLVVLYRFLEYYSKFDWDNYCISLKGPVCKSSLPDIVVRAPENGWTDDLMLCEEYLDNCIDMFSVSSRALEGNPKAFQPKNLNIIDPLRENNNLGRSVHLGNFYRIRSAFKHGARKLGQVLSLPFYKIAEEIHKFFSTTVARHGNDIRNSIRHLAFEFGEEESLTASRSSPVNFIPEDRVVNGNVGVTSVSKNEEPPLLMGYEGWYRTGVSSGHHSPVETYDVITSSSSLRKSIVGSPYHATHSNYTTPPPWNNWHQQFYFSDLSAENGSLENGNFLRNGLVDSASQTYDFNTWLMDSKEHWEANNRYQQCADGSLVIYSTNLGSAATKAHNLDNMSFDKDLDFTSMGDSEAFHPLADLTGDYDSHIRSLLSGQLYNGFSLSSVAQFTPFWWFHLPSMTIQSAPSEQHHWAAYSAPPTYGLCSEAQMAQGSGLHLPPPNGSFRETRTQLRSTNNPGYHNQFIRNGQSNGSYTAPVVRNTANDRHEVLPRKGESQQERRLGAKLPSPRPVGNDNKKDGNSSGSWRIEFGSIGKLAEEVISASSDTRGSTLGASPETKGKTAVMEQERFVAEQPIHLMYETEFPPLGL